MHSMMKLGFLLNTRMVAVDEGVGIWKPKVGCRNLDVAQRCMRCVWNCAVELTQPYAERLRHVELESDGCPTRLSRAGIKPHHHLGTRPTHTWPLTPAPRTSTPHARFFFQTGKTRVNWSAQGWTTCLEGSGSQLTSLSNISNRARFRSPNYPLHKPLLRRDIYDDWEGLSESRRADR